MKSSRAHSKNSSPSRYNEFKSLRTRLMVARRFLFIDPKKKAVAFLAFVALLSLVSSFVTLDNSLYIVQKHSVFNQYGVKLGWMWTCFTVGPFIWFSSRAHHRTDSFGGSGIRCDIIRYSRTMCKEKGGVWIPGFDISGHCFLLIYSMLVMAEEIKQLAISILYYHIMIDKIAGALVAIFWWYTTYHILYPNGFLQPPIHRTKPIANRRR
ncbi:unnamed protein product [Haemonchus placei]|uniref:PAP2_C domain-containing protein n=1 Tax=Haemonchus placei TaxID=6290 RepID=A0A0N4WS37_HAEPC|nr:unnamed protein product [Haemonchus placei]